MGSGDQAGCFPGGDAAGLRYRRRSLRAGGWSSCWAVAAAGALARLVCCGCFSKSGSSPMVLSDAARVPLLRWPLPGNPTFIHSYALLRYGCRTEIASYTIGIRLGWLLG